MIKNIETLKRIIPTIIGADFSKYETSIENARFWFISDVVGKKLFDYIDSLSSVDSLYKQSQKILAYKAYLIAIPMLDLVESDNGFAVVNDTKLLPASTTRVEALVKSLENLLNMAIDSLCEMLEDDRDLVKLWRECQGCSVLHNTLIPTLSMFREYGQFSGSRVEYSKQSSIFKSITANNIAPVISNELVNELIDQTWSGNMSQSNLTIINDVRIALANCIEGTIENSKYALNRVRKCLESKPDMFPAFKSSELYQNIINDKPSGAMNGIGVFF